jgi:hypothetical protein
MEQAVEVLYYFNRLQLSENIQGNIFEIGAYKGKLTLLLAEFLRSNEILGVCDIFDNQNLNLSSSGKGANLRDFNKNMRLLFNDLSFMKVFQKRSDLLMPFETGNNNRMFSVDGGHSKKETYDDMVIAANSMNEKGIIILDDYQNINWPGVKAGADEFLMNHNDMVPLAAFYNKFVLVKNQAREYYLDLLIKNGFESFCSAENYKVAEENLLSHSFLKIYQ